MPPLDVLRVPPAAINLADSFDFHSTQMRGVSLAVDADARERIAAASEAARLGAGGASEMVPFLIAMLDQDRTSAASGEVLAAFQAGRATTTDAHKAENMARLGEADLACQVAASDALAAFGQPAVHALVQALHGGSPNRRSGAAKALGKIGASAEAALQPLNELAKNDQSEHVRKAAAEAAKQIKPRKWFSF